MEAKNYHFDIPAKTSKVTFKNEFGLWKFFVNVSSNLRRQTYYVNENCENVLYSGNVILDPVNESLSKYADRIKITLKFVDSNDRQICGIDAKYIDKGLFYFCPSFPVVKVKSIGFDVIIPELKEINDLCSSKDYLKNLLINSKHTDFIIKAIDGEIKVHKIILMRCEFFENMLSNDTKEAENGVIEVTEEHSVMYEFCRYLYCETFDRSQTLALLIAADKYQIKDLFLECKQYLMKKITEENIFDILITTEQVQVEKLKTAALKFFFENREKLLVSERWTEMKRQDSNFAIAILEKSLLTN